MSSYRGYNSLEPGSAEGGNGAKKIGNGEKIGEWSEPSGSFGNRRMERVVAFLLPSCPPPPPLLLADFSLLFYPIFFLFPTVESVPRLGL